MARTVVSRKQRIALSLALILGATLASPPSNAADPSAVRTAEAIFDQSVVAYREGRFAEAVKLLDQAYAASPDPVLLYNRGRAYDAMGDFPRAIDSYTRYLREERNVVDRGAIEARIAMLRSKVEERAQLARAAERSGGPGVAPWVVVGSGAATLIAGAVLGALSASRDDEAQTERVQALAVDKQDEARTFATFANIGFIAGGVMVAGGLAWGLATLGQARAGRATALAPSPGGLRVVF
jgi:tetratricopeptide (TPR) repeat protein